MKIYSRFDRAETIPAPECPKEEQRYIEKIDRNGHSYLVEGEVVPFYENIQKYKEECDVYTILRRYEAGDPDVASKFGDSLGQYGDFTDLPVDIIDIKNKLNSATALFNSLPLEDREACDNSVNVFLSNLTKGILPNSLVKKDKEKTETTIDKKVEEIVNHDTTIGDVIKGGKSNE